jgi:type IV secretory pathway VirB2 component (pilin)
MSTSLLAKISITCEEIGNCSAKTPDLGTATTNIVQLLIGFIGMLAVIFIIVSGLQMVLSVGNPKRYQQAKLSLMYCIVGLFVAIVAFAFVDFIAKGL